MIFLLVETAIVGSISVPENMDTRHKDQAMFRVTLRVWAVYFLLGPTLRFPSSYNPQ